MVSIGRRDPDKSGAYDSGSKIMFAVFLGIHGTIFID
jgi:hypothetical protein